MRATATLTANLERRLLSYATAASAAGLGLLAFTPSAQARVIYTPAHVSIGPDDYSLDLNHDGLTDFVFSEVGGCDFSGCYNSLAVSPRGGAVRRSIGSMGYAAALNRGANIGPKKRWGYPYARMVGVTTYSGKSAAGGPWVNVKNRFLGFKFKINGQVHYGWARLNVTVKGVFDITGLLTGYAYETKPDKPIVAGDKGDATSLGQLALGESGAGKH